MSDLNNSISSLQYSSKKTMQKTMQNNIKKMEIALGSGTTCSSSMLKKLRKMELGMVNDTTTSSSMQKNLKKGELGMENSNSSSCMQKNVKKVEIAMENDSSSMKKSLKKSAMDMENDTISMKKKKEKMEMPMENDTKSLKIMEVAMENDTTISSVQKNLKFKELAMEHGGTTSSNMQKKKKKMEMSMENDVKSSIKMTKSSDEELAVLNLKQLAMAVENETTSSSRQKKMKKKKMVMEIDTKSSLKMKEKEVAMEIDTKSLLKMKEKEAAMEIDTRSSKKMKNKEKLMENDDKSLIKIKKTGECTKNGSGSGEEELGLLPRHTKVVITGNNRTKSVLVGLRGVVVKTVGLGGWHWLVLTNGIEVRLQRNALSVLEPPTGNEDDGDMELENEHRNGCGFAFDGTHKSYRSRRKQKSGLAWQKTVMQSLSSESQSKGSIANPPRSSKVDLSKLSDAALWKYWRQYNLGEVAPNPTKEQLIDVVQRHFDVQQVDELKAIPAFVKAAKRLKKVGK